MTIGTNLGTAAPWINAATTFQAILHIVPDVCSLIGLVLVGNALYRAVKAGEPGSQQTYGNVLSGLFFGAMIFSVANTMSAVSHEGGPTLNGLEGVPSVSSSMLLAQAMQAALSSLVILFGWFAFIRGLYAWANMGGAGTADKNLFWKGLTFVVSGAIAANIGPFLAALSLQYF